MQVVSIRVFLAKALGSGKRLMWRSMIVLFIMPGYFMCLVQAKENKTQDSKAQEKQAKENKVQKKVFVPQKPLTEMQGSFIAWYQQCVKKNYVSCGLVGRAYYEGYGVLPDIMRAKQYLTKACYNGVVESCLLLGNFTQGLEKQEYMLLLYQQACDLDHKESCIHLSDILLGQITKDSTQAKKQQVSAILRKICYLENDKNCFRAQAFDAQFNNENMLLAVEFQQALTECNKAQEGNADVKVCGEVGIKYANGVGVARDKEEAQKYFHIACQKYAEFCRYEVLDSILNK